MNSLTQEERIKWLEQRVSQLELIVMTMVPSLEQIQRATDQKLFELEVSTLDEEMFHAEAAAAELLSLVAIPDK
mgnify:CR=1 FL=1